MGVFVLPWFMPSWCGGGDPVPVIPSGAGRVFVVPRPGLIPEVIPAPSGSVRRARFLPVPPGLTPERVQSEGGRSALGAVPPVVA